MIILILLDMEIKIRTSEIFCSSTKQLEHNIKTYPECTSFVLIHDIELMYSGYSIINELLHSAAETFTCLEKMGLKSYAFQEKHLENIVNIISINPKLKSLEIVQFHPVPISLAKLSNAIVTSNIEEI